MKLMFKKLILALISTILFASLSFAEETYNRIVSLAPSITEILYALGEGDKVIGVTEFCRYPPEAALKPKVGGLLDTNYESIYALNPDLIIYTFGETGQKYTFDKMKLSSLDVKTHSVKDVFAAIETIGQTLHQDEKAGQLIAELKDRIQHIQTKTERLSKPRLLVVFMRTLGEKKIRDVYIAGGDPFYNELIALAGGENAYNGPQNVISPVLSAEGILKIDPDYIIEIMSPEETKYFSEEEIRNDWSSLPELTAYKNKHIFLMNKSYMGIPGPRFVLAVEDIAKTIHPDVAWE
jgi:iron complex transport system substrate-binding protein